MSLADLDETRPLDQPVGWFSPGRIEVLGKHTDYAGGRSLLAAVDRGVTVTVVPATSGITARTAALPGALRVVPGEPDELAGGHWGHYLQSVADRLFHNFGPLAPVDITIDSNLPLASGMSSSSALVVALAISLAEYNGFTTGERWRANIAGPADLAGYLACIENGMSFGQLAGHRGVGTFGGSEDHTAMICSQPDHLGLFGFNPIRRERSIPVPAELTFVVAVSGVAAEKTGPARDLYNRAALGVGEILKRWNMQGDLPVQRSLADAVRSSADAPARLAMLVAGDDYLRRRLAHFLAESEEIIPKAAEALSAGDLAAFGAAVDQSQQQASIALGNQVPETEFLAREARALGAIGSTSFGAGFGGSVWAMVPTTDAQGFAQEWLERYTGTYPLVASMASTIIARPGGPVRAVV